ncbi:hypothetical protein ACIA5G_32615 [Amycolatopsis sp. NPDC051758]|uniref:hypothetical protein n=1 Tax=Amycolatopsis sp. NPDC051758 TaxID=3363935 RepID=UPI00379D57F8
MEKSQTLLEKLTRLHEEYDDLNAKVMKETGGRDREALRRLSEVAGDLACIYEDEGQEMRRVAHAAYDLSLST